MTIEQTVTIPYDRRLTIEIPRELPVGKARATLTLIYDEEQELSKETHGASQQHSTTSRTPISRYFGIISEDTYGDGVAFQRKLRDEWNDL